jgi:hypothetical protein
MSGSVSKQRLRKVTERFLEHTVPRPNLAYRLQLSNRKFALSESTNSSSREFSALSVEELGEGGRFVPRRFIRAQNHGDVLLYRL